MLTAPNASKVLAELENEGLLMKSADGKEIYARRKAPHRDVDLRGAGNELRQTLRMPA